MNGVRPRRTERLVLRGRHDDDRAAWAAPDADPGGDFEHQAVPPGHPLPLHVLHRIRAEAVRQRAGVRR